MKSIIKGHFNELISNNDELSKERLAICEDCPLRKLTDIGPICNSSLYLDVVENIAYPNPGPNLVRGCGCRLNAKTRDEESECPAKKWVKVSKN